MHRYRPYPTARRFHESARQFRIADGRDEIHKSPCSPAFEGVDGAEMETVVQYGGGASDTVAHSEIVLGSISMSWSIRSSARAISCSMRTAQDGQ